MAGNYTEMSDDYKGKKIVDSSASVIGGVTGSIIGTWLVGPEAGILAGIVAGATFGEVVKKGLGEFANRFLSIREQFRVESTAKYAVIKIKQLLDEGKNPRNDDFFQRNETERSSADELFEGVLLKAKNENSEKKTKFLGYLFANVIFRADIHVNVANFMLSIAEQLSYRQLCFIALVHEKGILNIEALRRRTHPTLDLYILQKEEWYFCNSHGIALVDGNNEWEDWLSEFGETFYELLSLCEIPPEDLDNLSNLIGMCEASPPPLEWPENVKRAPENKRKHTT